MLGIIIHRLRKEKGWSQSQLAKELNISTSAVGMYEQERRTPDLEILITLSRLFDVSLDYLITGTEFRNLDASSLGHTLPEYGCYCKCHISFPCPCRKSR